VVKDARCGALTAQVFASAGNAQFTRDHFRLPEVRGRDCPALRRVRGEVHGRRCAGVFRLSARPRGRCRTGGTRRAGADRSGDSTCVARFAANSCRHCDRVGRRRRSDRIGGSAGARHCRGDTEPRGAPAKHRRPEHGRHRREHAKTARQSLRSGRPRGKGPQGHRRAGTGMGGVAALRCRARARDRRRSWRFRKNQVSPPVFTIACPVPLASAQVS
jgi:hypothetical protein